MDLTNGHRMCPNALHFEMYRSNKCLRNLLAFTSVKHKNLQCHGILSFKNLQAIESVSIINTFEAECMCNLVVLNV
jgi:hypothetical protein